jgi:hypothetical protein
MNKYTSILATEEHELVTSVDRFKRWTSFQMGFFLNGVAIGHGHLEGCHIVPRRNKKWLQTDAVALHTQYRNKGHGIHLYCALIKTAIALGATRIYSSRHLNKFSKRMWSVKLKKYFDVRPVISKKPCKQCGTRNPHTIAYYIDLAKLKQT